MKKHITHFIQNFNIFNFSMFSKQNLSLGIICYYFIKNIILNKVIKISLKQLFIN